MGFLQDVWHSMCKFFLSVWESFCLMLKGIVKFVGAAWDFLEEMFDHIFDLIAEGIVSLFILLIGPSDKNEDPLAKQLESQIKTAQNQGKIPVVPMDKLRIAAKVDNKTNQVTGYKAYEIDKNITDAGMKDIEKCLKNEVIIEIGK